MKSDVLRDKFLDFFKARKHKIIESDFLVPKDDPTVLFTPAGMNQFKKEFLGYISDFTRAATSQRCLRTDDLDKVGKTPGHHTFFEMLGNFSFGDYFKEEAIAWAWEFLTGELGIKKEKLWVSVYKDDAEAYRIWHDKIKAPGEKIIKLGDKENFWPSEAKEKGPCGPCGPCSEIFFDQGNKIGCGKPDCNPSCDCGRFVEVWNLVFTQFNRKEGGILEPLPKKNIDTGLGLERLAALMQGVHTNFETDLFIPLIKAITDELGSSVLAKDAIYAIADHIRAIAFAIYDGVLPSNEARGYVIRKIIRKAVLHLRAAKIKEPFLYKLVPALSEIMKRPYPELTSRRENIAEIILAEEKSFISTLDSSDSLLKEKYKDLFQKQDAEQSGKIAFRLYDTYGIPLDLTRGWLDKHAIKISQGAFDRELNAQKMRSKAQSQMRGDVFGVVGTDLGVKNTRFLGYKTYQTPAKLLKIIKDGAEAKRITKGEEAKIILDKTVFYAESGGQLGDIGELKRGKNIFEVLDTQSRDKVTIHIGRVKEGVFKSGDLVSLKLDIERRLAVARNHTATHLLQAALRKVLGAHVQQQGSLVAADKLRFDFTHFKDIKKEELDRVEEVVNNYILNNYKVKAQQIPLKEARSQGALAFFAEKYESNVRMVSIGDISKELCGGSHLDNTGSIGVFKITKEGSIASGIRRIEALTATAAYKAIKEQEALILEASSLLNTPEENIVPELKKRLKHLKELDRQLGRQKLDSLRLESDKMIEDAETIKDIKVITSIIENSDMELLRKTVDMLKQKVNNCVIALGSAGADSALLVMGITEDLVQKGYDAGKLIRDVAGVIGGSGGGRKDFAQAGGNKPGNFPAAFEKLKEII